MELNESGEPLGFGPAWACARYGLPNHNYHHCLSCHARYNLHLQGLLPQQEIA